jgi:hypothetical protein
MDTPPRHANPRSRCLRVRLCRRCDLGLRRRHQYWWQLRELAQPGLLSDSELRLTRSFYANLRTGRSHVRINWAHDSTRLHLAVREIALPSLVLVSTEIFRHAATRCARCERARFLPGSTPLTSFGECEQGGINRAARPCGLANVDDSLPGSVHTIHGDSDLRYQSLEQC